jgi:hypothetical protein
VNRREWLRRATVLAAAGVAADQLDVLDRLGHALFGRQSFPVPDLGGRIFASFGVPRIDARSEYRLTYNVCGPNGKWHLVGRMLTQWEREHSVVELRCPRDGGVGPLSLEWDAPALRLVDDHPTLSRVPLRKSLLIPPAEYTTDLPRSRYGLYVGDPRLMEVGRARS